MMMLWGLIPERRSVASGRIAGAHRRRSDGKIPQLGEDDFPVRRRRGRPDDRGRTYLPRRQPTGGQRFDRIAQKNKGARTFADSLPSSITDKMYLSVFDLCLIGNIWTAALVGDVAYPLRRSHKERGQSRHLAAIQRRQCRIPADIECFENVSPASQFFQQRTLRNCRLPCQSTDVAPQFWIYSVFNSGRTEKSKFFILTPVIVIFSSAGTMLFDEDSFEYLTVKANDRRLRIVLRLTDVSRSPICIKFHQICQRAGITIFPFHIIQNRSREGISRTFG